MRAIRAEDLLQRMADLRRHDVAVLDQMVGRQGEADDQVDLLGLDRRLVQGFANRRQQALHQHLVALGARAFASQRPLQTHIGWGQVHPHSLNQHARSSGRLS